MSKLIYKPETRYANQAKDAEEFLMLLRNRHEDAYNPVKALEYFFNDEKTKELVEKDNWDEVFDYWESCLKKGRFANWIPDILADFLYLLGIKFWEYFTKDASYYRSKAGLWLEGIEEIKDE